MQRPWESFFNAKIKKIFSEKKSIIDIGGGLRVLQDRGNRYNPDREWIRPFLSQVDYKILDPVPDFKPDIIGDIHKLPLESNSVDALICIAVLEHVENPIQSVAEMHRVLKPGGYCFIYVPFLFYYHAEQGYYKDYWRFTKDAMQYLGKDFQHAEVQNVRGALETWLKNSPLGKIQLLSHGAFLLDRLTHKVQSKQTSGYHAFFIK